jgi:hypothetical protein
VPSSASGSSREEDFESSTHNNFACMLQPLLLTTQAWPNCWLLQQGAQTARLQCRTIQSEQSSTETHHISIGRRHPLRRIMCTATHADVM